MTGQHGRKITVNFALSIVESKHNEIERSLDWLRADEAAVVLDINVRALYALEHRQGWQKSKIGNRTYYPRQSVGQYLLQTNRRAPWGELGEKFFDIERDPKLFGHFR